MQEYINELQSELKNIGIENKKISKEINVYKNADYDEMLKNSGSLSDDVLDYINKSQEYKKSMTSEQGKRDVSDSEKLDVANATISNVARFEIGKDKKIIIILGLPGSGKSSALDKIEKLYKTTFYLVDSDEFKYGVKGEEGKPVTEPLTDPDLKGVDVEYIHKAGSILAKFVLNLLVANDYNIALPKVGDDYESIKDLVNDLNSNGYHIYLHFVYTTVETALKRNVLRFKKAVEEGKEIRLVPPQDIVIMGYKPLLTFIKLIKLEFIEDFMIWDGEHYETPKVIYKK